MKSAKGVLLILMVLLFTGCIEQISDRFKKVDVVYVNLSVVTEENMTVIRDIQANKSELTRIYAPGFVAPERFPGIYVKIKQSYNISKPDLIKDISVPNGINYNGTGNYSFTVQLYENELNKTLPIYIYVEIVDNESKRPARTMIGVNLT